MTVCAGCGMEIRRDDGGCWVSEPWSWPNKFQDNTTYIMLCHGNDFGEYRIFPPHVPAEGEDMPRDRDNAYDTLATALFAAAFAVQNRAGSYSESQMMTVCDLAYRMVFMTLPAGDMHQAWQLVFEEEEKADALRKARAIIDRLAEIGGERIPG